MAEQEQSSKCSYDASLFQGGQAQGNDDNLLNAGDTMKFFSKSSKKVTNN